MVRRSIKVEDVNFAIGRLNSCAPLELIVSPVRAQFQCVEETGACMSAPPPSVSPCQQTIATGRRLRGRCGQWMQNCGSENGNVVIALGKARQEVPVDQSDRATSPKPIPLDSTKLSLSPSVAPWAFSQQNHAGKPPRQVTCTKPRPSAHRLLQEVEAVSAWCDRQGLVSPSPNWSPFRPRALRRRASKGDGAVRSPMCGTTRSHQRPIRMHRFCQCWPNRP